MEANHTYCVTELYLRHISIVSCQQKEFCLVVALSVRLLSLAPWTDTRRLTQPWIRCSNIEIRNGIEGDMLTRIQAKTPYVRKRPSRKRPIFLTFHNSVFLFFSFLVLFFLVIYVHSRVSSSVVSGFFVAGLYSHENTPESWIWPPPWISMSETGKPNLSNIKPWG